MQNFNLICGLSQTQIFKDEEVYILILEHLEGNKIGRPISLPITAKYSGELNFYDFKKNISYYSTLDFFNIGIQNKMFIPYDKLKKIQEDLKLNPERIKNHSQSSLQFKDVNQILEKLYYTNVIHLTKNKKKNWFSFIAFKKTTMNHAIHCIEKDNEDKLISYDSFSKKLYKYMSKSIYSRKSLNKINKNILNESKTLSKKELKAYEKYNKLELQKNKWCLNNSSPFNILGQKTGYCSNLFDKLLFDVVKDNILKKELNLNKDDTIFNFKFLLTLFEVMNLFNKPYFNYFKFVSSDNFSHLYFDFFSELTSITKGERKELVDTILEEDILITNKHYTYKGIVIYKTLAQQDISLQEAIKLFNGEKVPKTGFLSKGNKRFDAYLYINESNNISFDFS